MRFYGIKSGKNHLAKFIVRSYNFNKQKNKKSYNYINLYSNKKRAKNYKSKFNAKIILLTILLLIIAVSTISITIVSIETRNHDAEIQNSINKLNFDKADDLNGKYYFSNNGNNEKWKDWSYKIDIKRRSNLSDEELLKYYKEDYINIEITQAIHYTNQAWDYTVKVENDSNYKIRINDITFEDNEAMTDKEDNIRANIICNAKEKVTKIVSTSGNGERKDYGGSLTIKGNDDYEAYSVSDFTFKIIHKK